MGLPSGTLMLLTHSYYSLLFLIAFRTPWPIAGLMLAILNGNSATSVGNGWMTYFLSDVRVSVTVHCSPTLLFIDFLILGIRSIRAVLQLAPTYFQ